MDVLGKHDMFELVFDKYVTCEIFPFTILFVLLASACMLKLAVLTSGMYFSIYILETYSPLASQMHAFDPCSDRPRNSKT